MIVESNSKSTSIMPDGAWGLVTADRRGRLRVPDTTSPPTPVPSLT
jgi:hypothetical protein